MRKEGRVVLTAIAGVPVLLARLGFGVLRMAFQSRRSARRFRRTLRRKGVDRETARRLTARYRRQVSLRRLVGTALRAAR